MADGLEIRGLDEARRKAREIVERAENPDPVLNQVGDDLMRLWRREIESGQPNERWEAGPSLRAANTAGGRTLFDTGKMVSSVTYSVVGSDAVSVGSSFAVRGVSRDFPLLGIHEFGATVRPNRLPFLQFRLPWLPKGQQWRRVTRPIRIPARPTAPIDWKTMRLLPPGEAIVTRRLTGYVIEGRPGL